MLTDVEAFVQFSLDSVESSIGIPVWAILLIASIVCGAIAAVLAIRDRKQRDHDIHESSRRSAGSISHAENLGPNKLVVDCDVDDHILEDPDEDAVCGSKEKLGGSFDELAVTLEDESPERGEPAGKEREDDAEATELSKGSDTVVAPSYIYIEHGGLPASDFAEFRESSLDELEGAPDHKAQSPDDNSQKDSLHLPAQSILVDDPRPDAPPSAKIEVKIPAKTDQRYFRIS